MLNYNIKSGLKYLGNNDNLYLYLVGAEDENIITATIDDNCRFINYSAFATSYSLTSVMVGKSVKSIGDYAFYECYKLVEVINNSPYITIEKGSTDNGNLGYYALSVSNRDSDYVSKVSTDSNGYVIYTDGEDKILVNYVGNQLDLILPRGITKINEHAFYRNNNIARVNIADTVISIGDMSFYWCSYLTSVTIGNGLESIGSSAFENSALNSINYKGTEEEWNKINKDNYWNFNTGDYRINYNYDGN